MSDAITGHKISEYWLERWAETVDALIRIFQISGLRAYLETC